MCIPIGGASPGAPESWSLTSEGPCSSKYVLLPSIILPESLLGKQNSRLHLWYLVPSYLPSCRAFDNLGCKICILMRSSGDSYTHEKVSRIVLGHCVTPMWFTLFFFPWLWGSPCQWFPTCLEEVPTLLQALVLSSQIPVICPQPLSRIGCVCM